jgi:hypothetical protein
LVDCSLGGPGGYAEAVEVETITGRQSSVCKLYKQKLGLLGNAPSDRHPIYAITGKENTIQGGN